MKIIIEALKKADAEKLYEFELANRDYFEQMVPSRGDDYYNLSTFQERHEALLAEHTKGQSYYFLIKDATGAILGRMNLVDIDHVKKLGHVGYRVGKDHTGKGIANKALRLLLQMMKNQGVNQIIAKTTTYNIASQKVLERNGFTHLSTSDEEFEMNGHIMKFVHYRWTQ
ncbi:GNAT family N-acetyltransferase [Sutcliffiella horikoshii]|uniref:GNAT family N-acetyltransferase n=1 Tax=Sutcliffiella horikoshii TaxID=79883 RepID=UPI001F2848C4|nr:GNAT family N-acetyltransferase [Sutcliffiella horikoshii]MCG1023599.1 N-acetyltransferase [Sutcliffiella horikoshii]